MGTQRIPTLPFVAFALKAALTRVVVQGTSITGMQIDVQSDAGESRGLDGVEISGNTFHDFNGQSWITVNAADGSPGVGLNSAVAIRNNVFDSDADLRGGCAGSGGISYPVMMGMAARFGRFRVGSGRQRSGRYRTHSVPRMSKVPS